jgi:hypothetical protein
VRLGLFGAPDRIYAGRPTHLLAAEHMHVQVGDGVESVGPNVEDQPVPVLGDSGGLSTGLGSRKHLSDDRIVRRVDMGCVGDMGARNHQEMHRSGRIYVEKCVRLVTRDHFPRGHLAGQDFAEQAIGHQHEGTVTAVDGETTGDRLIASFEKWAAGQRATEHAAARARTAWLTRQSATTATWTGVLLDLAERESFVIVTLGPTHLSGRLVGVGADFCVLEQDNERPAVIALSSVTSVAAAPAGPSHSGPPGGHRPPSLELGLLAVLEGLMEERAPLVVHAASSAGRATPVEGELAAVGEDVTTVRSTGRPRRTVHIPLAAIVFCELR